MLLQLVSLLTTALSVFVVLMLFSTTTCAAWTTTAWTRASTPTSFQGCSQIDKLTAKHVCIPTTTGTSRLYASASLSSNNDKDDDSEMLKDINELLNTSTTTTTASRSGNTTATFSNVNASGTSSTPLYSTTAATNDTTTTNSDNNSKGKNKKDEKDIDVENEALQDKLQYLQSMGAITGRGEFASTQQKEYMYQVVSSLESLNPTENPTNSPLMIGRWELLLTNTQLFRGSPFFLAGRHTCTTPAQVEQYDWFCQMHRQALAISNIQNVRQIITSSGSSNTAGRIVSEFQVSVGAIPFLRDFTPFAYSGGLPVTITGAIVSSADWTSTSIVPSYPITTTSTSSRTSSNVGSVNTAMQLYMDTVEIKGSNIPVLRQLLDRPQVKLESRRLNDFLNSNVPSYQTPRPVLRTTFLNDRFRITRDVDDNVFVYVKTSDSVALTDYSKVDADLGILKLLQGFNDAVTKM